MGEKRIGVLLFPGFELLDVCGPAEVFGNTGMEICMLAEKKAPVASTQRARLDVDHDLASCPDLDVLLVPGGIGTREGIENDALIEWLRTRAAATERVLTVCTGTALLARTGLLDGLQATTNKRAFAWVAEQGPRVHWVKQARWVEDGKFVTSSGVSAGIDMALAVVEGMFGEDVAKGIADNTEYDWHRDPTWDPFARLHGLV